jgi:putative protease
MKSAYYAAVVTNAYRHALDAAEAGLPLQEVWRDEVNKVSHREYSTGFYFDRSGPGQHYADAMYTSTCDVAAVVESCDESGNAVLTQRNKFCRGDKLELLTPDSPPVPFTADMIKNGEGGEIESTPHPMMTLLMKLPTAAPKYSLVKKMK